MNILCHPKRGFLEKGEQVGVWIESDQVIRVANVTRLLEKWDIPERKLEREWSAYAYLSLDQKQQYRQLKNCCSLVCWGATWDPWRAKAKTY